MKELVVCKSCGYVMDKGKLKDKCPACGVPAKLFEPFTDKVSPRRRFLLALDLHPIMAHFPQAFTAAISILGLVLLAMGGTHRHLAATITVLGAALPLVVALTFLAGLIDGKIRFRRVTTPILKTKMTVGALFLLFSCGILAVVLARDPLDRAWQLTVLSLAIPAFICSSLLGLLGVRMLNSEFPG